MLLSGLIKAVKLIFDGIVSVIAFVLIKAGLWLCALFTFLYIIVCAILGEKLAGAALIFLVMGIVITAVLGVTLAVKRYISLKQAVPEKRKMRYLEKTDYKDEYKAKKAFETESTDSEWDNGPKKARAVPDEDRFAKANKEKRYKEPDIINNGYSNSPDYDGYGNSRANREYSDYSGGREHNNSYYGKPLYEKREQRDNPKFDSYYKQDYNPQKSKYEDFNDLKKRYFSNSSENRPYEETAAANDQKSQNYSQGYNNSSNYQNPQANGLNQNYSEPQGYNGYQNSQQSFSYNNQQPNNQTSEKQNRNKSPYNSFFARNDNNTESPMIFSTRRDPDILIHEYSDRLEFYRKNDYGGLTLLSVERKD